jgi:hypothetical protein
MQLGRHPAPIGRGGRSYEQPEARRSLVLSEPAMILYFIVLISLAMIILVAYLCREYRDGG